MDIKAKDRLEERELNVLSSQMKQYLIKRLQDSVKALGKLKENGRKVGEIGFLKSLHSIPLMQYGVTYRIEKERKTVHIQRLGNFKAIGLDQIPENAELASTDFIERNNDYFLRITVYLPKEQKINNGKAVGIELGIRDQIAFSNGIKVQYQVPVSDRKVRLYKVFSRSQYDPKAKLRSNRGYKLLNKIRKEFEHKNNIKRDINNKLASYVAENYEYVAYQNDSIYAWQRLFERRIYQTSIGEFRNALKASTPIEIGRFKKTTGICLNCGTSLNLTDRVFTRPSYGHS